MERRSLDDVKSLKYIDAVCSSVDVKEETLLVPTLMKLHTGKL